MNQYEKDDPMTDDECARCGHEGWRHFDEQPVYEDGVMVDSFPMNVECRICGDDCKEFVKEDDT